MENLLKNIDLHIQDSTKENIDFSITNEHVDLFIKKQQFKVLQSNVEVPFQATYSPTGKIYEQILKVMEEIKAIGKNRDMMQNGEKKWSFRGIEDMYNNIHPLFAKHGILTTCRDIKYEIRYEIAKNKFGEKQVERIIIKVIYRFIAIDGSFIETMSVGEGTDYADKTMGKAMSIADKIALVQMFKIPVKDLVDGDDDNIQTTNEIGSFLNSNLNENMSLEQFTAFLESKTTNDSMIKGISGLFKSNKSKAIEKAKELI